MVPHPCPMDTDPPEAPGGATGSSSTPGSVFSPCRTASLVRTNVTGSGTRGRASGDGDATVRTAGGLDRARAGDDGSGRDLPDERGRPGAGFHRAGRAAADRAPLALHRRGRHVRRGPRPAAHARGLVGVLPRADLVPAGGPRDLHPAGTPGRRAREHAPRAQRERRRGAGLGADRRVRRRRARLHPTGRGAHRQHHHAAPGLRVGAGDRRGRRGGRGERDRRGRWTAGPRRLLRRRVGLRHRRRAHLDDGRHDQHRTDRTDDPARGQLVGELGDRQPRPAGRTRGHGRAGRRDRATGGCAAGPGCCLLPPLPRPQRRPRQRPPPPPRPVPSRAAASPQGSGPSPVSWTRSSLPRPPRCPSWRPRPIRVPP